MINTEEITKGFRTPESRWSRFGPYYAMFPIDFAFEVIEKYSSKGDFIIDPFAGRCSSVFAGGVLGRHSLGIEINPVGWLYGKVKLRPADKNEVLERLGEIYARRNYYSRSMARMPLFFRMCYCDDVLKFLLAARSHLDWENNHVDSTLMSILLVYLHGKLGEGLSNQMRMTKAMGQIYSVKWWKGKSLTTPPEINPKDFITKKINWRYEKGMPNVFDSQVVFGDSTTALNSIVNNAQNSDIRFSLLFTSPPYCSVTDYHADQWLRLWLLGGQETPQSINEKHKGRFVSKENYTELLDSVFGQCSEMMADRSTVYVRTDSRPFTFNSTREILHKHFPNHSMKVTNKPFTNRTQTKICGNSSLEKGEIDIILTKE